MPSQVEPFIPSQVVQSTDQVLELTDVEAPALSCGYGENGESVQHPDVGTVLHPDRAPLLT